MRHLFKICRMGGCRDRTFCQPLIWTRMGNRASFASFRSSGTSTARSVVASATSGNNACAAVTATVDILRARRTVATLVQGCRRLQIEANLSKQKNSRLVCNGFICHVQSHVPVSRRSNIPVTEIEGSDIASLQRTTHTTCTQAISSLGFRASI